MNGKKKSKPSSQSKKVIQDSGARKHFGTGAVRDISVGKGKPCLLPWEPMLRLAQHYEAGAEKYASRNWEKGIPLSSFQNSAWNHVMKWLAGWLDEDHESAAMWNIAGYIWTRERIIDGTLPLSLLLEDSDLHPQLINEILDRTQTVQGGE